MKIFVFMGLLFIWSSQPLMMISSLILITLSYSMLIYSIMGSYWFSYMYMLVMLSGVMVLFTYMASLVPNENFEVVSLVYLVVFIMLMLLVGFDFNMFYSEDMSAVTLKIWESSMSVYSIYVVFFFVINYSNKSLDKKFEMWGFAKYLELSAWVKG